MFERLSAGEDGCSRDSVFSDRLHIQRILLDLAREAAVHLDDDKTEELLGRLAKVCSESSVPLSAVGAGEALVRSWSALDVYLRLEMCGGRCVEHLVLAFQMVSSALASSPNCVFLLFTPLDETSGSCPVESLCGMLRRMFFGQQGSDSRDFRVLLKSVDLLQTGQEKESSSPGESGAVSLLVGSLELLQLMFKCIDDSTFMFGADFRQTENFSSGVKAVLETYLPIFQTVLSSRLMQRRRGRETDGVKEARIGVLKTLERLALVLSGTDLLPRLLGSLGEEAVSEQGTVFESLMDILSPDFPSWYASGQGELGSFVLVQQLQFAGFLFLKSLSEGLGDDPSSVTDLFLGVRRQHIPLDELPDFVSKSSYWFSDVRDRLNFDRESTSFSGSPQHGASLPQHVNSIFSNLFYRVAAAALHNGLKLQQNMIDFSKVRETLHESVSGDKTSTMKRLHSLKIDLFTLNVQIIAQVIVSIVSTSGDEASWEELRRSSPSAEAVSALELFLVWICEFVFDYKSKIPQLRLLLEEINLIKIRLPVLHNAFGGQESPSA